MKYIDADLLKKEIERRKAELDEQIGDVWDSKSALRINELDRLLAVLNSLQQEQQEEPDKSLQEEIKKEMVKLPFFIRGKDQIAFARHFAQWGAEHLHDTSMMGNLEEEIETWIPAHINVKTDETLPINSSELADVCKEWGKCIARHFAEWQKSQMLREAYVESQIVEDGRIELEGDPLPCLNPIILLPYPQFNPGDKVRIVVLKEEE